MAGRPRQAKRFLVMPRHERRQKLVRLATRDVPAILEIGKGNPQAEIATCAKCLGLETPGTNKWLLQINFR